MLLIADKVPAIGAPFLVATVVLMELRVELQPIGEDPLLEPALEAVGGMIAHKPLVGSLLIELIIVLDISILHPDDELLAGFLLQLTDVQIDGLGAAEAIL